MAQVFISYSKEDRTSAVAWAEKLRMAGVRVWLDHTNIRAGMRWPRNLGEAIAQSTQFLLLWSKDAATSDFVDLEWNIAIALKKAVIPICLDSTPLPPTLAPLACATEGKIDDILNAAKASNTATNWREGADPAVLEVLNSTEDDYSVQDVRRALENVGAERPAAIRAHGDVHVGDVHVSHSPVPLTVAIVALAVLAASSILLIGRQGWRDRTVDEVPSEPPELVVTATREGSAIVQPPPTNNTARSQGSVDAPAGNGPEIPPSKGVSAGSMASPPALQGASAGDVGSPPVGNDLAARSSSVAHASLPHLVAADAVKTQQPVSVVLPGPDVEIGPTMQKPASAKSSCTVDAKAYLTSGRKLEPSQIKRILCACLPKNGTLDELSIDNGRYRASVELLHPSRCQTALDQEVNGGNFAIHKREK